MHEDTSSNKTMITFKEFLLEGGNATSKYNTERATGSDIKHVLGKLSSILSIPVQELKNDLLGSTGLTLKGVKKDSGDIDIAMNAQDSAITEIDKKMKAAVNGEGVYNAGTKVGSYAFPVGDKKVQVDLMFVNNKDWAKFIYHAAQGDGSNYPGAVRNIILMTALAHTQEDGKDFVIRDDSGKSIVRASKAIRMDSGMQRLFKMAKKNPKTGEYNKSVETVSPDELEAHLKEIGKDIKFSKDQDHTNNPDEIAAHIFGKGVKAKDLMTAEDVIKQINKLKNASEVKAAARKELERIKLPVPSEL